MKEEELPYELVPKVERSGSSSKSGSSSAPKEQWMCLDCCALANRSCRGNHAVMNPRAALKRQLSMSAESVGQQLDDRIMEQAVRDAQLPDVVDALKILSGLAVSCDVTLGEGVARRLSVPAPPHCALFRLALALLVANGDLGNQRGEVEGEEPLFEGGCPSFSPTSDLAPVKTEDESGDSASLLHDPGASAAAQSAVAVCAAGQLTQPCQLTQAAQTSGTVHDAAAVQPPTAVEEPAVALPRKRKARRAPAAAQPSSKGHLPAADRGRPPKPPRPPAAARRPAAPPSAPDVRPKVSRKVKRGKEAVGWCVVQGCMRRFYTWKSYRKHFRLVHDILSKGTCNLCLRWVTPQTRRLHSRQHETKCSKCPARFLTEENALQHVNVYHTKEALRDTCYYASTWS